MALWVKESILGKDKGLISVEMVAVIDEVRLRTKLPGFKSHLQSAYWLQGFRVSCSSSSCFSLPVTVVRMLLTHDRQWAGIQLEKLP